MTFRSDFLLLSAYVALLCSVGILTQATHLPSQTKGQDLSHRGHGVQHKGHGHAQLGKKDELEVELLKLKQSANEDKADPISGSSSSLRDTSRGQPEYTNEDMEGELTEVRPLDIPLHLLQLETVEDLEHQRYATGTMRTFGEVDFPGLTTIASRMNELQLREELDDKLQGGSDWAREDDSNDMRTEEAEHSGDGTNLSPTDGSTTEQYTEKTEDNEKDDDDDDGDGDDASDDESNEDDDDDHVDEESDEDGDEDEDDGDGDDEYEDNTDDEDENEDSTKLSPSENADDKRRLYEKKSERQMKPAESTFQKSKTSMDFEDSVEHGRQWKEEDSEGVSTPGARSGTEWPHTTTTNSPDTSRTALERDLATFLRNGSPEVQDPEIRNVTKRIGTDNSERTTKKHSESDEAKFDVVQKLQQVRELDKRANIPQKLVDAVSPKAGEDLLELMVRIAENPSEWQRVHHMLQQLDEDLATSKKSLDEAKSLEISNHRAEEKTTNVGEAVFSNKSKGKTQHRKHQHEDKKKKKKKKQRQKENMKTKEEKETLKFKVKGKEEIRREELSKAGILSPANVLLKGNEKGDIPKVSKETSKVKSYLGKISEDPPRSEIKGNSLKYLDSANTRDRNKNKSFDSNRTPTENGWLSRQAQNDRNGHMSSIDSAIAYLSSSEQPLAHLNTNKLPAPAKSNKVPDRYDWRESLKDDGTDLYRINSWPKPSVNWHRNSNNWYGSFSNSKPHQDMENSYRRPDEWARILSGSKSAYRETDRNDFAGIPGFSASLGKDVPESKISGFSASLGKDVHESRIPDFSRYLGKNVPESRMADFSSSRGKDVPESKARTWKESRTKFNWSGLNPKEERRYYSGDRVYNSPNTAWPRFSVESLKHGNLAGNFKAWPDIPLDQSMGWNENGNNLDETSDNWPNFSITNPPTYTWPNISDYNANHNSIVDGKTSAWSKPSLDLAISKEREVMTNTWSESHSSHQKPVSAIDTAIAHHTKEASSSKQWPHFAYHRVTSSPQILAQQQKEAQQRARHRNAYIAVSVIAPPGKWKGLNKTQSRTNSSQLQAPENARNNISGPPAKPSAAPLPDKMDQLLEMRSGKQKFPDGGDLLEEELVDMAVMGQQERVDMPWNHARHLDKMQEQLKTLSAMGEKLRHQWLEKERLLQILRDGDKSGSGFFRLPRDDSTGQETTTTTATTTSIVSPDRLITPHTTHPPPAP